MKIYETLLEYYIKLSQDKDVTIKEKDEYKLIITKLTYYLIEEKEGY